jgi:3-oxoacyl-[acyl-carrier-protein] synthase-3
MKNSRRAVRICGTGAAVPDHVLSSEAIDRQFGLPAGTVFARHGVRERRLTTTENAAQLAVEAAGMALRNAGLEWADIDCLVAASATMDQALPYNAAMVLAALGPQARPIAAFDIGASCMSFLVGLDTLSYLVDSGRYRHVLIVSSDIATFSLDWSTLGESALFGDGAAAVVIRKSTAGESSMILDSRIETFAQGADLCSIRAGGSRYHPRRMDESIDPFSLFHMDGPRLFRIASRELPRFFRQLLDDAGLTAAQLRLVVPHQASRLALDHLARRLCLDASRIVDILEYFGNQVGASLPSALHHAVANSRMSRGDPIVLLGSGAGVTIGGIVMVY